MKTHVVSIGCRHDQILHRIGPLALAAAAPVGLVIDLDPDALPLPGATTLAALCTDGLQGVHLRPPRAGVAVLPNGGVEPDEAAGVVEALIGAWPAVVLREARPDIEIIPLIPGMPVPIPERAAVYQPLRKTAKSPGVGVVLPRLRRAVAASLIRGQLPIDRRWITAWGAVLEERWA